MRRGEPGRSSGFPGGGGGTQLYQRRRKLGVSQSALSHTVRGSRSGSAIRLLTRTTRSVAPTEAGERLLETSVRALEEIDAELAALTRAARETGRHHPHHRRRACRGDVLWPRWPGSCRHIRHQGGAHRRYGLTDIVAERYDAGVRLGEQVAKDMIAVRDRTGHADGSGRSPVLFRRRPRPKTPQDLTDHDCINLRLPTHGGLYAWEFEKGGRELKVRVEGQLVFNSIALMLEAALAGFGLAYLPEDQVRAHLADGRLIRVLADWCPRFSGYHLYYPHRRQATPAFGLLVDALRYRG